MKLFAFFYHNSTGYVTGSIPPAFHPSHIRPIPATGSDSVLYLDARLNLSNAASIAREICKKRGFIGFTLNRGKTILNEKEVRPLELLSI